MRSTTRLVTRSFSTGSHPAEIRVYGKARNVLAKHEHAGDFHEPETVFRKSADLCREASGARSNILEAFLELGAAVKPRTSDGDVTRRGDRGSVSDDFWLSPQAMISAPGRRLLSDEEWQE